MRTSTRPNKFFKNENKTNNYENENIAFSIIQTVTGVKVIIEIFFPEVHKMLPEVENKGQHFTN